MSQNIKQAPLHMIMEQGDTVRTYEIVYFKSNNNQILVDHVRETQNRMESLGYIVTFK